MLLPAQSAAAAASGCHPLQNVRRQGGEIWEAMRTWVDGGEMEHVIMATAVYDLASGRVDFFGLQTS